MTDPMIDLSAPRLACKVCHGEGMTHHEGFTSVEGKVFPAWDSPCNACDRTGWFTPPDVSDILGRIVAKKGKNKGSLRASFTSPTGQRTPTPEQSQEQVRAERAYYVWRLARFHGGADPTMPWTATLFSRGDPYLPILDDMADKVAKRAFGTDLGGAAAWAPALLGSEDLAKFRASRPEADPLSRFLP